MGLGSWVQVCGVGWWVVSVNGARRIRTVAIGKGGGRRQRAQDALRRRRPWGVGVVGVNGRETHNGGVARGGSGYEAHNGDGGRGGWQQRARDAAAAMGV
jgi:hypothetical protein